MPLREDETAIGPYRIHSVEYGDPDAEALVLLHGLSGSSRWWTRNVPALAARYRVVLPDLIGFGRTPRSWRRLPDLQTLAGVLAEWLAAVGMERVHLVGHSMGGQAAIHLAASHPDRVDRLVLVDPAGVPRVLSARAVVAFAAEIAPLWRWGDPRFLPVIAGDAMTAGPRTIFEAIRHIMRDDVREVLPRIQAPTLVIWGERDNWIPLQHAYEFRERIPEARLAVLRGACHNPMVDRPEAFNRLVLRFLEGEPVGK
jgi:pimeloyl-ACP methyl ester carboxylesterase